ncbi:MAG: hypothetical protein ABFR75_02455 [Acidobacteriota bacterium]
MKRIILKILMIIIAILFLWSGFNLITDIKEPKFEAAGNMDTSSLVAFLNELFPPIPIEKDNGFYKLWTMSEPPDVDVESDEIFKMQKDLNDPETATEQSVREWTASSKNPKNKKFFKSFSKKRREILKKGGHWDNYSQYANKDWGRSIIENREDVLKIQKLMKPLMERYEKAINSGYFEDYTLVVFKDDKINFAAVTIPNLLAWLQVAKQHTAINVLNAMEGDWANSVTNILDNTDFAKRATKGSRTLITNLVAKAVLKISLWGLSSIMNQPECPDEVFQLVLNRMPDLKYEEYGSRKPLLAEGFSTSQVSSINPLFQNKRTKKYYYDHLSKIIESERIPPYKWGSDPRELEKVKNGFFWWVQNPFGKLKHTKELIENIPTVSLKSWHTKVLYDMTRISAELHLKYDPSISVQENLDGLDTYRSLTDPCSGKPYIWHEKKQMLYSYGADRDDDGGKDGPVKSWDADFFLSIILYVK